MITDKQADAALFAVELEDTIVAIVRGTGSRRREHPISRKDITTRVVKNLMFRKVTDNQINEAIDDMLIVSRIRIVGMSLSSHRRHNGAYGYVLA